MISKLDGENEFSKQQYLESQKFIAKNSVTKLADAFKPMVMEFQDQVGAA